MVFNVSMNKGYVLLVLLLAACGQDGRQADRSAARSSAPSSPLEGAALKAGVIVDAAAVSPVGLYRHRHEAGLDSLCIVKGTDGVLDFGLEAMFGEGVKCRGHGTLRASGDKLIMNFARSACLIVAGYEGDRVSLPGALDMQCASLCSERGSLEGVSFPRVSREEGVARDARGENRNRLCS
jgi:hypothetical protein